MMEKRRVLFWARTHQRFFNLSKIVDPAAVIIQTKGNIEIEEGIYSIKEWSHGKLFLGCFYSWTKEHRLSLSAVSLLINVKIVALFRKIYLQPLRR